MLHTRNHQVVMTLSYSVVINTGRSGTVKLPPGIHNVWHQWACLLNYPIWMLLWSGATMAIHISSAKTNTGNMMRGGATLYRVTQNHWRPGMVFPARSLQLCDGKMERHTSSRTGCSGSSMIHRWKLTIPLADWPTPTGSTVQIWRTRTMRRTVWIGHNTLLSRPKSPRPHLCAMTPVSWWLLWSWPLLWSGSKGSKRESLNVPMW